MKLIDGKGQSLGRLASFVAKEALKGEELRIFNCDRVIITGNFEATKKDFEEMRDRVGHSQKGPKHHANSEKIVKRTIRGMIPNHRTGRGKEAFGRIRCFAGIPKEFAEATLIELPTKRKIKYSEVKEFTRQ